MAPKKKGVSFVKADKISVDTSKQQAASKKKATVPSVAAAPTASALKKKQTTTVAKKETSKINRLAGASKIAASAGKKQEKKSSTAGDSTTTATTSTATGTTTSSTTLKKSKKDKKRCPPFVALQLRNLPDAFQEPQLRKFLAQFDVPVGQMFIQRTKKRATSRGLAYIRFAPKGTAQEKTLDVILEEVSAMNLGGKTVAAKWVTMTRKMPTRRTSDARRQVEYLNKTKGFTLEQHDTRHFDWVARLQRGAKNENGANKFLKSIGVNYSFAGFNDQLPLLTKQVKDVSSKAQSAVKMTRLATSIGRRKGFTNSGMLKKVLKKKSSKRKVVRQRRAEKKKGAKKETTTTTTTAAATKRVSTSPKRPAAKKATK